MKHITLLLIAIAFSIASFAQSHTAHDAQMARFKKFYNAKMDDSIRNMFSPATWGDVPPQQLWATGECKELQKKYGEIKSFTYIGEMDDDPTVKLYKVVTTKMTYATGISIDKDSKLETFRFHTSSDHIDKLMKAAK